MSTHASSGRGTMGQNSNRWDPAERARQPDGSINPHMLYLPDSRYFDPGSPQPTEWDGVGQYMKPKVRSAPTYTAIEAVATDDAAGDPAAAERRERLSEHSRLVEYRRRLGLDGPQDVPQHVRDYKPPTRPKWVPYVVRSNPYRDVQWEPPKPEVDRAPDVSTADAVEQPVPPPRESPHASVERRRRIVAYDDGDPFPFPVHALAPPPADAGAPPMEHFGTALTCIVLTHKILLFTPSRDRVYQLLVASPQDGWSAVPLRGTPPPASCVFAPIGDSHVAAFSRGDRVYTLTLQSMSWGCVIVPKFQLAEEPTFAHVIPGEMKCYVRGLSSHYEVSFRRLEMREDDDALPGEERLSGYRRFRLAATAKNLRVKPPDDFLEAVAGAPGFATATSTGPRGDDHSWIFKYEPKALTWLPHERIDFAHPVGVTLGPKVLFFANDTTPEALRLAGARGGGTCVVANLHMESGRVTQVPTAGDVRVMLDRHDILALAPTRRADSTVLCVTADFASFLVLEVDRWEKIKGYVFKGEHDFHAALDPKQLQ